MATAIVFLYTKDGTTPQTKYYKTSSVNIAKGHVCYFVSGYVTTATVANVRTGNIAGVSEASITTAATEVPVQVNRAAVYKFPTTANTAQSYVGTDVELDDFNCVDENEPKTGSTGVIRIEKIIGAAADRRIEGSINYATPSAIH